MNKTRPCVILGENIPAKFHKFYTRSYVVAPSLLKGGHPGGQVSNEYALIELADGTVESVPWCNIRFTDTELKIKLNPDAGVVERVRTALKENDGYCPCALHKLPEHKCMCKAFREQNKPGPCHCGLYIKVEGDN